MPNDLLEDLIAASKQELERLAEPRNRPRYFMFGATDACAEGGMHTIRFANVPHVVSDAAASSHMRTELDLFRVGDVFGVPGSMRVPDCGGVEITFDGDGLAATGLDGHAVLRAAEQGIDFIMDSRDFVCNTLEALLELRGTPTPLLEAMVEERAAHKMTRMCASDNPSNLNASQASAIARASQQAVTFVWGPPGTGKTTTLGELAARLVHAGKRVLLTGLSGAATDQLLSQAVRRLPAVELSHQVTKTSVARVGRTRNAECMPYAREAFQSQSFGALRAATGWQNHVRGASLVAATFAGVGYHGLRRGEDGRIGLGRFDYVIADEVSMASIPQLASLCLFSPSAIALGGDPMQLPPIFPEDAEQPNRWFSESIFEVAAVTDRHDPRVAFLDTQYRMNRQIGDLVSYLFYDCELRSATEDTRSVECFQAPCIFVHCEGPSEFQPQAVDDQTRRFNSTHALAVARVVARAIAHGLSPEDIAVIAPYNAQVVRIRETLMSLVPSALAGDEHTRVATVHSFQGQEKRMVIVDFTDDDVMPSPLTARRELINVALSRAKEQLVLVGNRNYLVNPAYLPEDARMMFGEILHWVSANTLEWSKL